MEDKLHRFASVFQKLAAGDPPEGFEPLPAEDPAIHQMAERLLPRYWTSSLGTLIPFTINNIQYVARLESHGVDAPKAITVYVKQGEFTPRTRNNLRKLNPIFKSMVAQLITRARAAGMNLELVQGWRSPAEQQKYIEKGTGSKMSLHPHGLAVDIAARDKQGKVYFPDRAWYSNLAVIAKSLGMEWAGDWGDDLNHFQYPQMGAGKLMTAKPPAPALPAAPSAAPKPVASDEEATMAEFSQLLPQLYWT